VARAAGRVDEAHVFEPELGDGRVERLVEDEFLDKLRRLEERVALTDRLGEILVQVAEEARVLAREHQGGRAVRMRLRKKSSSALAPSLDGESTQTGLCLVSKTSRAPGSLESSRNTASRYSRGPRNGATWR
jgi:hypothetical protein